jgi:hypothetical protein
MVLLDDRTSNNTPHTSSILEKSHIVQKLMDHTIQDKISKNSCRVYYLVERMLKHECNMTGIMCYCARVRRVG